MNADKLDGDRMLGALLLYSAAVYGIALGYIIIRLVHA